jgi:hypothetical protein
MAMEDLGQGFKEGKIGMGRMVRTDLSPAYLVQTTTFLLSTIY